VAGRVKHAAGRVNHAVARPPRSPVSRAQDLIEDIDQAHHVADQLEGGADELAQDLGVIRREVEDDRRRRELKPEEVEVHRGDIQVQYAADRARAHAGCGGCRAGPGFHRQLHQSHDGGADGPARLVAYRGPDHPHGDDHVVADREPLDAERSCKGRLAMAQLSARDRDADPGLGGLSCLSGHRSPTEQNESGGGDESD
jgi:hypothetical protein